ncbi:MAG: hypothetical protein WCP70_09645 [Methanothrix sp.]
MHCTPSGDRRQALQKEARELARDARALQKVARAPAARQEAQRLQGEADAALAEAGVLKTQARLEDLTVWQMEKVKQSRKGSKTYSYIPQAHGLIESLNAATIVTRKYL